MTSPDEHSPEKKDSENEVVPAGPKQKAKCLEKETKSPPKPSDLSKAERKEKNNKTARRDVKSSRGNVKTMKPSVVKVEERSSRSKKSIREGKLKNFSLPKDEPEITALQLDAELTKSARLMEEYKIALEQIITTLVSMMRRGNGTVDMENIVSDKGQTAAEKLNKEVQLTQNYWKTDTKLQPAMNDAIAKNTVVLAAAERNLQTQGPQHLKRVKKFLYGQYPKYVDMKRDLLKIVKQQKPEAQSVRDESAQAISKFIKEKYVNAKIYASRRNSKCFRRVELFPSYIRFYLASNR
ncbi:LEDGF domain-containing protein [Caenorhabditis elegans]|uniref:LEDGF domain-containing protein n=1 Tax=Caenorhabditis elegans TaxID=6239 RepID=Q21876_CAEEL|nr:LEDGF domain-containing protein [Caenorhabditis elegans]CAA94302.3 LEDGF domain-containing protein [Caenorhabditis elegans]|eukprot:NP_501895.2 Uncharacterized protein CELE_R09E10.1 [Caenorhabditis elegans]